MTSSDLIQKLKLYSPTQRQTAKELGLSPAYLNDVITGRREISERVAEKLGYTREVIFKKIT